MKSFRADSITDDLVMLLNKCTPFTMVDGGLLGDFNRKRRNASKREVDLALKKIINNMDGEKFSRMIEATPEKMFQPRRISHEVAPEKTFQSHWIFHTYSHTDPYTKRVALTKLAFNLRSVAPWLLAKLDATALAAVIHFIKNSPDIRNSDELTLMSKEMLRLIILEIRDSETKRKEITSEALRLAIEFSTSVFEVLLTSRNSEANREMLAKIPDTTLRMVLELRDPSSLVRRTDLNTFIDLLNRMDDQALNECTSICGYDDWMLLPPPYNFGLLAAASRYQSHEALRVLLLRLSPFMVAAFDMKDFLDNLFENYSIHKIMSLEEALKIRNTFLEIWSFVKLPEMWAEENPEAFLEVVNDVYFSMPRLMYREKWVEFFERVAGFFSGDVIKGIADRYRDIAGKELVVKELAVSTPAPVVDPAEEKKSVIKEEVVVDEPVETPRVAQSGLITAFIPVVAPAAVEETQSTAEDQSSTVSRAERWNAASNSLLSANSMHSASLLTDRFATYQSSIEVGKTIRCFGS